MRVFENRALRRIFGLKIEEVTGGWRKLHNEELHNFYSALNIIRSRDSSVGIATGHRMERRGIEFDSRQGQGIFQFSTANI
jgi:hypothetical protein